MSTEQSGNNKYFLINDFGFFILLLSQGELNMIINTGMRTDIPAFYSQWLMNRIRAGFVLVRNPFHLEMITRYELDPSVVDCLAFCTKNPEPMLKHLGELKKYHQFWFVTITPYGKEIEPNVPPKEKVMESFAALSNAVGIDCVNWRYDPILIDSTYTLERHISDFEQMCRTLSGYTKVCVISFIDLYEKVIRNFPQVRSVTPRERITIGKTFSEIGSRYGITVKACAEGKELEKYGIDCGGCMTKETLEAAIGSRLAVVKNKSQRSECSPKGHLLGGACVLGNDIGAYNTCRHFCKYCYANYDRESVRRSASLHDPLSPMLVGDLREGESVHQANQKSWIDRQLTLF